MRIKLKYFALADANAAVITSLGDNTAAIQSGAATPAACTFGRGVGSLEAGFSAPGGSSGPGGGPKP
ncbi:MAG: hypothetical protein KUG71_02945 [Porticoccaceae bacterium]|nr:hypothetical protein [Porticoccaceae bacterium]